MLIEENYRKERIVTMNRILLFVMLLGSCRGLLAQEWEVSIKSNCAFRDVVPADNRQSAFGVGGMELDANIKDGFIVKINSDGNCASRIVHEPGMILQYHSAVQLPNGNFMAFGICDDSLCDPVYQKYLRIDVFDEELECVSSKMYNVDDDVFDCFYNSLYFGELMKSVVTPKGTVVLAAKPSFHYVSPIVNVYKSLLRFYEFDDTGELLKIEDYPASQSVIGAIKEITYEPHSDNLMVFVDGGWFGNASGVSGILVVDTAFQIVARQSLLHLGCSEYVTNNACEGRWFDDDRLIIDLERYESGSLAYHSLHVVDSALNLYASLRLPPYDSTAMAPHGTSTAYVDDSTIFAFTYCRERINRPGNYLTNVFLVDKNLNLLGRKVMKAVDTTIYVGQPVTFADGGCLVPVYADNDLDYFHFSLMKLRREDIEITWDVVKEKKTYQCTPAYPNPASEVINIPIDEAFCQKRRLQIFDMKGEKCFDCAISGQGNLITMNIGNLDAGLYVYKVVSENKVIISGKFVKQ